jgi:DNA-binding SARP family transcriptional activator
MGSFVANGRRDVVHPATSTGGGAWAVRKSSGSDVHLHLLGDWFLTVAGGEDELDGRPAVELPSGPQHLIAYLALHGRSARSLAAATLWPDHTDQVAAGRLRAVLWRLRHRHADLPPLLEISDTSLSLASDVVVDVHSFVTAAGQLIRCTGEPDEDTAATVLGSAELLPGWYDDWVLAARERLQQLRLGALDALSGIRRAQQRRHEALQAAFAATGIEPLHESAHRTIALTHLDNGDIVEAVEHYKQFRAMLDSELGLPPSEQFTNLIQPYLNRGRRRSRRTRGRGRRIRT